MKPKLARVPLLLVLERLQVTPVSSLLVNETIHRSFVRRRRTQWPAKIWAELFTARDNLLILLVLERLKETLVSNLLAIETIHQGSVKLREIQLHAGIATGFSNARGRMDSVRIVITRWLNQTICNVPYSHLNTINVHMNKVYFKSIGFGNLTVIWYCC